MPSLKIKEPSGEREAKITGSRLTIGRLPENDIVLIDETISRHHAELILKHGDYILKDLGTRNGTWVNGERIKEIKLKNGDEIKIGTITLSFLSLAKPSVIYEAKEDWLNNPSTMIRPPSLPLAAISEHKKLEIIYNISQAVSSIFDLKELMEKVAGLVLEVIKADRFLLMLRDEKTGEIVPQMAIGNDKREVEIGISQTMVRRVTSEGVSILVRNTREDLHFREAQSLILKNIRSILCAPLLSKEGILGLIYVDSSQETISFSEDELELFTAIGNQVAVAFKNIRMQEKLWQKKRMEKELEIAARIQQSFLPRIFPASPGYKFGVKSFPAYNVGGDFYDCFNLAPNKLGLVVGDVSGKGIPAALYMARFVSEFKIAALNFPKPHLLLAEINRKLRDIVLGGNFVSAAYLILELDSGTLSYALAGSHPLLLCQDKEKVIKELVSSGGQVLGIRDGSFKDEVIKLSVGDMVVLYTDGLIEAKNRNKKEFGLDRLKEVILRYKGLPVEEIMEKIIEDVSKFSQGQDPVDDLTLLVLKADDIDKK